MNAALIYEIIGYLASALVVISLMMSSILRLRVINLIGAVTFTLYGLLIAAYPVAATNFIIVLIDLYYLWQIYAAKEYFKFLKVEKGSDYLQYFLSFYDKEIKNFLPNFAYVPSETQQVFFVLRNMVPAGLFIAEPLTDDALFVKLDFVIPGYRDFKIAKFIYAAQSEVFKTKTWGKVYSEPGNKKHEDYLRRMGFVKEPDKDKLYRLDLA